MSRTDAHSPFRVRVARREITVVAVHRCGGRDCDLPDRVVGRAGHCHWEFVYTGRGICSCNLCHGPHRQHARRSAVRTRMRDEVREWNGGEREA